MKRMKATLPRLWRLTRTTSIVVGLAVMLALVAGVASIAVAQKKPPPGSTPPINLLLNVVNSVTAFTSMEGSVADNPILRLVNKGTGAALDLQSQAGKPPMTVSGTGADSEKVTNLNADKVDGKDSTQLAGAPGPAGPAGTEVKSALVSRDGTFVRGTVGTQSSLSTDEFAPPGSYTVTFNADVSQCVAVGSPSLADANTQEAFPAGGHVFTSYGPDPHVINVNTAVVGQFAQVPFSLQVACPSPS